MAGRSRGQRRIEADLERWGHALHDALFTAEANRELLKKLLAAPEPRELTLATQDPVLLRMPWELIADGAGRLAQRVSVRRQLEEPERGPTRAAKLPVRILYIVSRPADAGFIDPRFTTKGFLRLSIRLGRACGWISAVRPPWRGWKKCCGQGSGRRRIRPCPFRRAWQLFAAFADRRIVFRGARRWDWGLEDRPGLCRTAGGSAFEV